MATMPQHTRHHISSSSHSLDDLLPQLGSQRLCVSIMVPLGDSSAPKKERLLRVKNAIRRATVRLDERSGLHPCFTPSERAAMEERLTKLAKHEKLLDGYESSMSLAIYVTPEHSVVMGLETWHDPLIMLGEHPYTLSLVEQMQHTTQDRGFYLFDVSAHALQTWRVDSDGSRSLTHEVSMEQDIDYRPAAGYADDEDAALQGRGGSGARSATFHGHDAHEAQHFEARQKRMWRDAYQESLSKISSSMVPRVLRGEHAQRHAFLNTVGLDEDDFAMQTNLQHQGTTTEHMLGLMEQLGDAHTYHATLKDRWERANKQGLTSGNIRQIARQVAQGLVEVLWIARTGPMWGEYSACTGDLLIHDNPRMSSGEVRDQIARRARELGSEVHLIDQDEMPVNAPFAAITRSTVA